MAFEEFDRRERSQADGSPIRLYLLEWGNTRWRYTSADQPISRYEDEDGVRKIVTYVPVACNDEGMTQGGSSNNVFTLHIPGNLPVVELYRSTPPTGSIWLTVRTIHKPHDAVPPLPQIAEPHRYWRLRLGASYSDYIGFRSIVMAETVGGPQRAFGGSAISSGWIYDWEPGNESYSDEKAFDNLDYTTWINRNGGAVDTDWIGYDFGEPVEINELRTIGRPYYPEQSAKWGYLEYSDDGVTWFTLWRKDFSRAEASSEQELSWQRPPSALETDAPIYWIGTVGNIKRPDPAKATIFGRPITATFKRVGLRLCWTRGCPHALYDDECRVDPAAHRKTGTVFMAGGATVVVELDAPVADASAYIGGIFEWTANADGTKDSRTIENATGSGDTLTLTIFGTADRIDAESECSVLPGCDLTPETCQARFNNLANYGGFKQMAGKSPFDGTPIF